MKRNTKIGPLINNAISTGLDHSKKLSPSVRDIIGTATAKTSSIQPTISTPGESESPHFSNMDSENSGYELNLANETYRTTNPMAANTNSK